MNSIDECCVSAFGERAEGATATRGSQNDQDDSDARHHSDDKAKTKTVQLLAIEITKSIDQTPTFD